METKLKSRRVWVAIIAAVVLLAAVALLSQFSLSALPEPGAVETLVATRVKEFLVGREAAKDLPPAPPSQPGSLARGRGQFMANCSSCHGVDGAEPTELGLSFYPRTPSLASSRIQQYSDAELFWIITNGIRLSGMPAFGNSLPSEERWLIVQFLRTLNEEPEN